MTGSTRLELILPFENTYSSADNSAFQVVTVPLCNIAYITDNIDAIPWNGKTGGIISLLSYNDITVDSKIISASNNGFRGANDYEDPPDDPSPLPTNFWATQINVEARTGFKGESYIGFPTFGNERTNYPNDFDCGKGAPGNAGGGGNAIDGGGGGGGNAGLGGNGGIGLVAFTDSVTGTVTLVDVSAGLGGAATPQTPQRLFFGN